MDDSVAGELLESLRQRKVGTRKEDHISERAIKKRRESGWTTGLSSPEDYVMFSTCTLHFALFALSLDPVAVNGPSLPTKAEDWRLVGEELNDHLEDGDCCHCAGIPTLARLFDQAPAQNVLGQIPTSLAGHAKGGFFRPSVDPFGTTHSH